MTDPVRPGLVRALVGPDSSRDFSGLSWRERMNLRRVGVKVPPAIQAFADTNGVPPNIFTDHSSPTTCRCGERASSSHSGAQPDPGGEAGSGLNFQEAQ